MTYHIGDQLEVKIKKIVPNGLGLAFAENLTVFVPLSVKDDTLAVEIRQVKGRTAFASILKILDASPSRVTSPCPYFGDCGGCDFQQMNYEAQLESKIEIVRDCLSRIGHIDPSHEIRAIPCPKENGYRLRTQFHADASSHSIGFFKRQSHQIIDIDHCMVLTEPMNRTLTGIRENLDRYAGDEDMVHIEAAAVEEVTSLYGENLFEPTVEIPISAAGEKFFFNARSFFQANEPLLETLIEVAVGTETGKTAIDLYSGVGLFSIPLVRRFESVTAVESDPDAIRFMKKNRDTARAANLEIFEGRVREFLKEKGGTRADLVVVDPPRSGVKEKVLKKIAEVCERRLVYVSCNPSTLARDLAILLKLGFEIENITAIDLFPQTHHVETVVRLARTVS